MSEQLSIPLKKSIDINFEECVKKLMKPCIKKDKELEKSLSDLDKLRKDVIKKPQKTAFMLDQLYRYHDQIQVLEKKFPSETIVGTFTWEDAFSKVSVFSGKPTVSLPYLGYERHCVLFNIGALQTQLAVDCSVLDTDEERKLAAKYFQSASGIFEFLKPSESAGDNLTPDFHPDLLTALSSIMLAQAQEMFVTKAIKDKMKDAIIAKLCIQTEEMFANILVEMTRDTVKYSWDRSWLQNIKGKKHGYIGLAHFFQSKVCNEKKLIGEEISRLNVCCEQLKKAQDKIGNANFLSYFLTEAKRFLSLATKDNDFIYHEPIPAAANLPTIQKVASARLAKVTPLPEKFAPEFNNPFEILIKKEEPAAPSAPPRKTKGNKEAGDATDGSSESPVTEATEKEQSGRKSNGHIPTWNQVLNDSWSLVKSSASTYVENLVFGKQNPPPQS